jgi:LysM repeat protein
MERGFRSVFIYIVILALVLTACDSAGTPVSTEQAIAQATATPAATATPTSAPTVSVPTPTLSPPTPTSTRVVSSPTPHPTLPPTATPAAPAGRIYVVEESDTLLGIALEFDLTAEELATANGIDVDDFLQLGQELIIPEPTAAPTKETTAAGQATVTSTTAGNGQALLAKTTAETEPVAAETAPTSAAPVPPPTSLPAPTPLPIPTVDLPANVNPLTGRVVADPSVLRRRPLMVRVGNDVGARQSQVGLNSADIVYEDITEWWVTRFTAIYLANTPDTVGPVRSARLINVQLVPQYQGALAHSGGSDPVRWEISQAPIVNLDEYFNPRPYFYRPNEGWQTRLAINTQATRDYMADKKLEAPVKLPGFLFSDIIEEGEPGESIYVPYPKSTSFTEWHYDNASSKYLRWINGFPLNDVASGQVAAGNVVIYFAEHQDTDIVEDTNGATSIRIIVSGFGAAWFFRDGKLNKGFWQTDGSRPPYFTFADGRPYPLKPGNTWVEVVPTYYKIGVNSVDEASSRP